jgi:serine protease Do
MQRSTLLMALAALLFLLPGRLGAAERVIIDLNDGSRIEGEILKKDANFVHLSLADQVVTVNRAQIKEITTLSGEQEQPADVVEFQLYKTGTGVVKDVGAFAEQFGPAIVTVKTPSGLGTGWFCDPAGYVVTNAHVIANDRSITITAFQRQGDRFENRVFRKVKIVAVNDDTDLALLKIEDDLGMQVPQLHIGDSTKMKVGDSVFTIGNPMGLERSTSQGTVSRANRNMSGRLYIQSTTPIAPGNSGGPLFNERGEVIGITNMGYITLDGLGFAVPSQYVKEFLDNVEAFAYDPDNPNSGINYMEAPVTSTDGTLKFTQADFIKAGQGISCLKLADINGDGVEEALFVNNNKGEIDMLRRRRPEEVEEQAADYEDINSIPDSADFKLVTHAVNNKISAIDVADMNGDGRPDIVFVGDIDGLGVLEQDADGGFGPARRIEKVEVAARPDALTVADLDGDGKKEILALGKTEFSILREGAEREAIPLNARYRDRIVKYRVVDVNGDGRLDIVFFTADKQYAAQVMVQNGEGKFVEEELINAHLSGPVEPYNPGGAGNRFLTLDKGQNRLRDLLLTSEDQPPAEGRINVSLQSVVLDSTPGTAGDFEVADLDGDGRPEIVSSNKSKNEFLVLQRTDAGFVMHESPAPRSLQGLKLYRPAEGRPVLFSFSVEDKIFGASLVEDGSISFPRPINTDGQVQSLWLSRVEGDAPSLVWVEKGDKDYVLRTAPAQAVADQVAAGGTGSIDVPAASLLFGEDADHLKAELARKPADLAFADFNGDGLTDLVIYWSYSGKESLYLGLGGGKFKAVIVDQEFLDLQEGQPLLVADVDGDGHDDVLLVQPGFVRVLKVDGKQKLYVERQFNWKFDTISRLVPYPGGERPRFVALAGDLARVIEFDVKGSSFSLVATIDLAGLEPGPMKVADLDGNGAPDLILLGGNALTLLYATDTCRALHEDVIFDAKLDTFSYWNVRPADLDGDGKDEVMLFDSKKAMFEVYRPGAQGELKPILRQRLFEKTIMQRGDTNSYEMPRELAVGDVDGNGRPDLVFVLEDRVAVYLQHAGQ